MAKKAKRRSRKTGGRQEILASLEAAISDSGDIDATRTFWDHDPQWSDVRALIKSKELKAQDAGANKHGRYVEVSLTDKGASTLVGNPTTLGDLFELDADVANPKAKRSKAAARRGNTHDPKKSADRFLGAVRRAGKAIKDSGREAEAGELIKAIDLMISAGYWLGVADRELSYAEMGAQVDAAALAEFKRLERSRRYWANNTASFLGLQPMVLMDRSRTYTSESFR